MNDFNKKIKSINEEIEKLELEIIKLEYEVKYLKEVLKKRNHNKLQLLRSFRTSF